MRQGSTIFFWLVVLSGVLVAAGWILPARLAGPGRRRAVFHGLAYWTAKGILVPCVVWALMNVGLGWDLEPFMPQIQLAQASGLNWLPVFMRYAANGLFIITSYWLAVTLAWQLQRTTSELGEQDAAAFKSLCWTCGIGMVLPAGIIVVLGGWKTLGLAGAAVTAPILLYAPGMLRPRRLPPLYAQAIARMKFGKYTEAEWEIIRQLERSEDDFEGWMLLAELYANHFNDLGEAEKTVLEICEQPRTTPSQMSVALHRLADWQLRLGEDPAAARRSLNSICARMPGSHLAHMAQLRIRQLPETPEELRERNLSPPIPLPSATDPVRPPTAQESTEARDLAAECVRKLKENPDDPEPRDRLARLYAERLGDAEQALEQLRQLLCLENQPPDRRAEWLSLSAQWLLKYRHDGAAARLVLEELVRDYPDSGPGRAAKRKLAVMKSPPGGVSG